MFDGYTFLQHWVWTPLESVTTYNISESRKKCFLNMCSILKCCSTFLSLLSLFCFCILQIRIERRVSLMVMWGPGWLSHVTSDIVGFSNKVEMVVGGGLRFLCACFS